MKGKGKEWRKWKGIFQAGTHEATNRCNTLWQQVALCVQSSDKSYALIAAIIAATNRQV